MENSKTTPVVLTRKGFSVLIDQLAREGFAYNELWHFFGCSKEKNLPFFDFENVEDGDCYPFFPLFPEEGGMEAVRYVSNCYTGVQSEVIYDASLNSYIPKWYISLERYQELKKAKDFWIEKVEKI